MAQASAGFLEAAVRGECRAERRFRLGRPRMRNSERTGVNHVGFSEQVGGRSGVALAQQEHAEREGRHGDERIVGAECLTPHSECGAKQDGSRIDLCALFQQCGQIVQRSRNDGITGGIDLPAQLE